MARMQPTIPVSPKMYRHFAIITVALTACLAMFADGENRQTIEDHLSKKRQNQEMVEAEREMSKQGKGGNTSFKFVNKRSTKGTFGRDERTDFVTNYVGGAGDSGAPDVVVVSSDYGVGSEEEIVIPTVPPPGMSMEEFQKLREELLRRKQARKSRSRPAVRATQELIDASRARSQTVRY